MSTAVANKSNGKTEIAQSPANRLRGLLETMKGQIAAALPRHMTPERMIRVVMTSVQRNPALLECSELSLIGAIVQASQIGLEPDGMLGRAYLIPRNNRKSGQKEANLQVGYKGLLELARRSGEIKQVDARVVFRGENFSYRYGLHSDLQHEPNESDDAVQMPGANGENCTHVYAVVHLKDGGVQFNVMTAGQINAHKKRYAQKPKYGDWIWETNWDEMAKKTVLIKTLKLCPASVELHTAIAIDTQNTLAMAGVLDASPAALPPSSLDQLTDQLSGERDDVRQIATAKDVANPNDLIPIAAVTELSEIAHDKGIDLAKYMNKQFKHDDLERLTNAQAATLRDYLESAE